MFESVHTFFVKVFTIVLYLCLIKDYAMATGKMRLVVYIDLEMAEDFQLLFQIWEMKCKRRGIFPSRSRFVDGILKEYVEREKALFIAEAKQKYAKK